MTVPNLKDTITKYRAVYANETGRRRAFLILNAAAWDSRETGAGLYYKTGDNSYNERSSDILMFQGIAEAPAGKGPTFDALGDAENMAKPIWNSTRNPATGATGFGDLRNWRAPVDPVQFDSSDDHQPEPVDPEALLRDVRDTLAATLAKIDSALRTLAGQPRTAAQRGADVTQTASRRRPGR